jgi:homocysteine S-methyltransferase
MATVTEVLAGASGAATFICDFSPPRGANPKHFPDLTELGAEFVCVAYNPGRSVRVDSVAAAFEIKRTTGTEVIFNMSPRDMNKLALESRLLGAELLGLDNIVVVQGDAFTERDLSGPVNEYTATELISAVRRLNEGFDHRDSKLRSRCHFCIGATIDLARGTRTEALLTQKKVAAGAHFFITQAVFGASELQEFTEIYAELGGDAIETPIFWGLQILTPDGVMFGDVPKNLQRDLEQGRDAIDIALEGYGLLREAGVNGIYLVPPILKGGSRDYTAAQRFLQEVRAGD